MEAERRKLKIEIKLIQTTPGGKELLLAHPQVMTFEGQPACIDIQPNIPSPKGIKLDGPLRSGLYVLVNVLRKDGRLFLDATVNKSETSRADAESVSISTQSVRVVELITLGKRIVVPVSQSENLRWELLVQGPPSKASIGKTAIATPTPVPRRSDQNR